MKLKELIEQLSKFSPDAKVKIISTHNGGDDVTPWEIYCVHDEWAIEKEHDMVSIEFQFDERPDYHLDTRESA